MAHESAFDAFYTRLKESSEAGTLPNDENKSTKGENEVQPEPKEEGGCLDSSWGEAGPQAGGRNQPNVNGDAAIAADQLERVAVVNNLLEGKDAVDKTEQALMAANFAHVTSGDFTTHSLHLRPKMSEKTAMPRVPTLSQSVLRITGRL